jgi:hydroxyacylglutathione hydrolase
MKLRRARPEPVAEGIWRFRGGLPRRWLNVYFLEDDDGVTIFDCGTQALAGQIKEAAEYLGGARRLVLGHAHADHRGSAAKLGLPVLCHELEREDAQGDGGRHYFSGEGFSRRQIALLDYLLKRWDGGPVAVSETLREGDLVAGCRVVHLPGHAPGQIGLYRESDGVALTSDCFYTMDTQTFRYGTARVPSAGVNQDTEEARESIRKLAGLELSAAWPGHAEPVRGDIRAELLRAAGSI